MRKLIAIEPRIGYHGEAHYMFISNEKLDKTRDKLLRLIQTLNSTA